MLTMLGQRGYAFREELREYRLGQFDTETDTDTGQLDDDIQADKMFDSFLQSCRGPVTAVNRLFYSGLSGWDPETVQRMVWSLPVRARVFAVCRLALYSTSPSPHSDLAF